MNFDDGLCDSFDDAYACESVVVEVRQIVQDFRKLCDFVMNSSYRIAKVEDLKKKLSDANDTTLNDGKMRWTSMLIMINQMLQLKEPINDFLKLYDSPAVNIKLGGNEMKVPYITSEKWAIIHGLSYMLTGFERGTTILGAEKFPSFSSSLPVLRFMYNCISDSNMFNFTDRSTLSRRQTQFLDIFGEESFFNDVSRKLEECRLLLWNECCKRFNNLDTFVPWYTLLDPRYNFKAAHWKDEYEKGTAKSFLVEEVTQLNCNVSSNEHQPIVIDSDDEFSFRQYTSVSETEYHKLEDTNQNLAMIQEVESYLNDIDGCKESNFDPLEWWRVNRNKYPNVARAARKWLSVSETRRPRDRVKSLYGIDAGSKLSGEVEKLNESLIFMHHNYAQYMSMK